MDSDNQWFEALKNDVESDDPERFLRHFDVFLNALERGELRAASPVNDSDHTQGHSHWQVNHEVKQAILYGFKMGHLALFEGSPQSFCDKSTYPPQKIDYKQRKIRLVPGGSSVRRGAHIANSVTIMPPAYVNVGAYVGSGSMIDSHALVGSCAQIGEGCHVSAAAQIGGVLEPIGALPVIIEDNVFVGGNCGIYEGCHVQSGAVIAAGTILTRATAIYDTVHERIIRSVDGVLRVPPHAVIIPGSRPLTSAFAREHGLQAYSPIIIKYRDAKTDAATALEDSLR